MNSIIITSIICISIIAIVTIICYYNWKNINSNELASIHKYIHSINSKLNDYLNVDLNNKIKIIEKLDHYKVINEEINNIKCLINSTQSGIEFISMQISNKENNKDNQ